MQERYGVSNALQLGIEKAVETRNAPGWAGSVFNSY